VADHISVSLDSTPLGLGVSSGISFTRSKDACASPKIPSNDANAEGSALPESLATIPTPAWTSWIATMIEWASWAWAVTKSVGETVGSSLPHAATTYATGSVASTAIMVFRSWSMDRTLEAIGWRIGPFPL
jgi:hypothetical protein